MPICAIILRYQIICFDICKMLQPALSLSQQPVSSRNYPFTKCDDQIALQTPSLWNHQGSFLQSRDKRNHSRET
ncbi:hypothetical protein XENTR_v10007815 [Xenopus tropicalis]|nr:hypothetical protein XENTR_v10007815 [Xenopus tropicalis]